MSAKIMRTVRNTETLDDGITPNPDYQPDRPMLWMECLVEDSDPPKWAEMRTDGQHVFPQEFVQFPTHGAADERVAQLRTKGITHCFARTIPNYEHQRPSIESIPLQPPLPMPPVHRERKSHPRKTPNAEHRTSNTEQARLPYRDD